MNISSNSFQRFNEELEEDDSERKALIEDEELCDDEVDLFSSRPYGVRNRQLNTRNRNHAANNKGALELRDFNRQNKPRDNISEPNYEFTYYQIQPGDSLQSICLNYACSINQVKRLNGMISDQDFYGLRQIKLPLGKLGLLEDILKAQSGNTSQGTKIVNSPGSALSVSRRNNPQFEPLLEQGSSDDLLLADNVQRVETQHKKSISYIQPEFEDRIDDLLTTESIDNVGRVFQNLDYHVDKAKAAAETYDQRAVDLVDGIEGNGNSVHLDYQRQKVSKIPELFFCNENFGLDYKKLLVFIFIVCLVVPSLLYIDLKAFVTKQPNSSPAKQTNLVTAQSRQLEA